MKTYFIQAVGGGPIKIGVSINPESRLRGIQTGCPYRLRLLATLPTNKEAELHSIFNNLRLEGEWFKDEGKIKKWIQRNTLVSDRKKVSKRKSENPWAGVIPGKRDYVERYCDVILEPDDFWEYMLEDRDIGDSFGECRLLEKRNKAVAQKNTYRSNVLEAAIESCECDFHIWVGAVSELSCCDVVDRFGVNKEHRQILLACKPLVTRNREDQIFRILPDIAVDFDFLEWKLFGWIEGPTFEAHSVSFYWLNYYSDEVLLAATVA